MNGESADGHDEGKETKREQKGRRYRDIMCCVAANSAPSISK